ncbi:MAG: WD40 repeat domain-containing protein [Saprospiraceae bacterium]|nr:WD40 repeat domain-containing protein [Saprospiraceae bacterium]
MKYPSLQFRFIYLFLAFFLNLSFPAGSCAQNGHEFSWSGHNGRIRRIIVSDDNKFVITAGEDGTIKIWDKLSGALVRTILVDRNFIYHMAVSKDQQFIAAGLSKSFSVFNFNSGKLLYNKEMGNSIEAVSFTPDSKSLVVATENDSIVQWEAKSEKIINVFEQPNKKITYLDISDDGNYMLAGGDSLLVLWNLKENKIIKQFSDPEYMKNGGVRFFPKSQKFLFSNYEHIAIKDFDGKTIGTPITQFANRTIWSMKISPDEQFLLATTSDHYPAAWNLNTGELVFIYSYSFRLWDVCFTPDGKEYAVVGQSPPVFWNFTNRELVRCFDGLMSKIQSIEQSPDYKQFLIHQFETTDNYTMVSHYLIMDAKTFKLDTICENDAWALTSLSNNNLFTINSGNELREVWDKSTRKKKYSFPKASSSEASKMTISPDGMFVLIEESKLVQLFTTSGSLINQLPRDGSWFEYYAAFSSTGKYVTLSGVEGELPSMLDGKTLEQRTKLQYPQDNTIYMDSEIRHVAFSPDEKLLAGASKSGSMYVWDTETGKMLHILQGSRLIRATFSPDNQYIMGSHADMSTSIWRLSDGALVKTLTLPQAGDPEFTIDPEFRVWKWMEWAFFLP